MTARQRLDGPAEFRALRVKQWLSVWDSVRFDTSMHQRRPEPHFYLLSMPANTLRQLAGIQRRTTEGMLPRTADLGIQRVHDTQRSQEIADYVQYGFPWSGLSSKHRETAFRDLRKPGWLPTAIVVNVIPSGEARTGTELVEQDAISVIETSDGGAAFRLPESFSEPGWNPAVKPLEIIDGQHRLWAFDENEDVSDFELPVVAFHGLDISWQAYLFWTINIRPRRINASLAFDLYPLLRAEDWLERFEGHPIYRETRAQELVQELWAQPASPWHDRINMLGQTGLSAPMVRQAAWIRSLLATFVKRWPAQGRQIGGLFGAVSGEHSTVLPWNRHQQAAFLISAGDRLRRAIGQTNSEWAVPLRASWDRKEDDPAFYGRNSLLATDQGIRGFLYILNDLCFLRAGQLQLQSWQAGLEASDAGGDPIQDALDSLECHQRLAKFLDELAEHLAEFDWRTSAEPTLTSEEVMDKAAFRGSGGYRLLRLQLHAHLAKAGGLIGEVASVALELLN